MTTGQRPVKSAPRLMEHEGRQFFEVTMERVIGEIELSPNGTQGPFQAAMELIARDGDEGTYRFPGHDGRTVVVEIRFEEPA